MQKWEETARESVFDLVYSGVRGHMTNGDTFAVWLAGGANDRSASVETWKQKFAVEMASRVALRVKDRGAKGKPCLNEALADAKQVATAVGDVTVILVSNGKIPVRGTPFDEELNKEFQGFTQAVRTGQATLNTVLVAQEGEFVAWSVNSPDFLIAMPKVPPKKNPPKPSIAAPAQKVPETNPPALAKVLGAAAPPLMASSTVPMASRPIGKPLIITRETVDRERQATRAMAATFDERAASGSSSNSAQTNAELVIVATNSVTTPPAVLVTEAPQSNSSAAAPSDATNANNTSRLHARIASPAPAPRSSNVVGSAVLPETNRATASVLALQPPAPKAGRTPIVHGLLWAGAGALGCGGVLLVFWLLRRERSSEISLVSQAVAMERIREQP